ncbi:hypothetical protein [Methylosinus sporium]|uniref:hypothetical protein n=1 Tax=Methylosinus sporium TaxID=428 RepID=UPI00383AB12F
MLRAVANSDGEHPGPSAKTHIASRLSTLACNDATQSGVDLPTIQAWLGHSQVATTHRDAAADVEMMGRGLEKAGVSGADAARFKPKDAVLRLF